MKIHGQYMRYVFLFLLLMCTQSSRLRAQTGMPVSVYAGMGLRGTLNYQNTVLTVTEFRFASSPDIFVGIRLPFDAASALSGQLEYGIHSYGTKNTEGTPLNLTTSPFLMETTLRYHTLKALISIADLGFRGTIHAGAKIGIPISGQYRGSMDIFQTGRIFQADSTITVQTNNMQSLIEAVIGGSYIIGRPAGSPLELRFEAGYVMGELLARNLPITVNNQLPVLGYRTLGIQPITVTLSVLWTLPL